MKNQFKNVVRYNYKKKRNAISVEAVKNAIQFLEFSHVKLTTSNSREMTLICQSINIKNNLGNRTQLYQIWRRYIKNSIAFNNNVEVLPKIAVSLQHEIQDNINAHVEKTSLTNPTTNLLPEHELDSIQDTELIQHQTSNSELVDLSMPIYTEEVLKININDENTTAIDTEKTYNINLIKNQERKKLDMRTYRKCHFTVNISNEIWKQIFMPQENKLDSYLYSSVISEIMTKQTGCLIKIKGYDISKSHISISTYCEEPTIEIYNKLVKSLN